MEQIVLISQTNFTRSYSGFQYLADSLHKRGLNLRVFAPIPLSAMPEALALPYPVHSCYEGLVGRLPKLRHVFFRRKIRKALNGGCRAVIMNSYNPDQYYLEGIAFKKEHQNKVLIQYCPELWLLGDKGKFTSIQREIFKNNAELPDMIVDVDAYRANIRREHLGLSASVEVIPNTLPLKTLPEPAPPGTLAHLAGCVIPTDKNILLFTGVASDKLVGEVKAIMNHVSERIFLLWFAHGSEKTVFNARKALQRTFGSNRIHVSSAVARTHLLCAQHEADAGLIAYSWRQVKTMNQKYAAPTKLYEYLANGLPIASYGNPTILDLVERYDIGCCAKEDTPQSLAQAIENLFDRGDFSKLRHHTKEVFAEHLCYEKSSKDVMDRMFSLINNSAQ